MANVTRLLVEEVSPQPSPMVSIAPPEPPPTIEAIQLPPPQEVKPRITFAPPETVPPDPTEIALAAFKALGFALSARALLCLALLGAFALGVFVMVTPDVIRLLALIAYCILTIAPLTYLEKTKGR